MKSKTIILIFVALMVLLFASCNRGSYKVVQKFKPQQTIYTGQHIYSSKRAAVKDARQLEEQNSNLFDYYVIKVD